MTENCLNDEKIAAQMRDLEENLKAAEMIGIKTQKFDLKTDDFEQIKKSLI